MTTLARDSEKDPEESVTAGYRFGDELAAGETIVSAVVSLTLVSGTALPALTAGSPQISGGDVLHLMAGGAAGSLWHRQCKATTSAGQILVRARLTPIADL